MNREKRYLHTRHILGFIGRELGKVGSLITIFSTFSPFTYYILDWRCLDQSSGLTRRTRPMSLSKDKIELMTHSFSTCSTMTSSCIAGMEFSIQTVSFWLPFHLSSRNSSSNRPSQSTTTRSYSYRRQIPRIYRHFSGEQVILYHA